MAAPNKPRVVVTNRVFPETRALLETYAVVDVNDDTQPWPRDELLARCREAQGLMAFMTDLVDAELVAACPRLRIIGAALKGYDNIDVAACTRAGVRVAIVPDLLTVPTAELTIGLMLALGRNIVAGDTAIRRHGFHGWRPALYGSGIAGTTVGIYGFGLVGRAIAQRLRAFECRLLVTDNAPPPDPVPDVTCTTPNELLAESDYLLLALPLTATTQHLINRQAVARMKHGARIINAARGSLVDEAAIADALEAGHLAGYAADVFECEDWARPDRPATPDARLCATGARSVLTPHIGSAVLNARREIERTAADAIIDVLSGREPRHSVNLPQQQETDDQPDPRANLSHHH